jgi:hypothetical protein
VGDELVLSLERQGRPLNVSVALTEAPRNAE